MYDEYEVKLVPRIWTVAELTGEIGRTLAENRDIQNCWVSGELSNYKNHRPSGHWYFTLKDESASIKAVMFRSRAERVEFSPADGMKVLIRGSLRLYERDGNVQFYAEDMQPIGVGALYLALEQLKERLAREGLFDPMRKKQIPRFPRRVGIVTSPTGAALQDMLNIIRRRNPKVSILLAPAAVQGDSAPREVAKAIMRLNNQACVDLIIVGRGGGSLEELWAFNTEEVARAIASSAIPLISAVGHETDFTVADLVADLRAPTPSAAAELAVPVLRELQEDLVGLSDRLQSAIRTQIDRKRRDVRNLGSKGSLTDPYWRINLNRQRLDGITEELEQGITRFVSDKNGILRLLAAKLDLLSPLAILGRGYSIAYGQDSKILHSSEEVEIDEEIKVRLAQGTVNCKVITKERLNV